MTANTPDTGADTGNGDVDATALYSVPDTPPMSATCRDCARSTDTAVIRPFPAPSGDGTGADTVQVCARCWTARYTGQSRDSFTGAGWSTQGKSRWMGYYALALLAAGRGIRDTARKTGFAGAEIRQYRADVIRDTGADTGAVPAALARGADIPTLTRLI
jgi:hypothetical protein